LLNLGVYMSYGQNLPQGLQASRSLGSTSWNSQVSSYLIQSGYKNNIFKGDPVVVAGTADSGGQLTGYLISVYDIGNSQNAPWTNSATLGVFDGCAYSTPTASNPIDPGSPGRQYWPAGTVTLNGLPAIGYVIDDPNTIFNAQTVFTGNVGAAQNSVGATCTFVFTSSNTSTGYGTSTVTGNTNTGISQVSVNLATAARGTGSNLNNLIITNIVPSPPNPAPTSQTANPPFNNVEGLIQNHQYAQRAIARA
jgi:hypothetical protein